MFYFLRDGKGMVLTMLCRDATSVYMEGMKGMKGRLIKSSLIFVLCAFSLFLFAFGSFAGDREYILEWTFDDGWDEGWRPTHSFEEFRIEDGILYTVVTGPDPFMHSPEGLSINADEVKFMEVRIKCDEPGTTLTTYWITSEDLQWAENKRTGVPMKETSEFETYIIDFRNIPAWNSTVPQFRIDVDEPPAGTEVEIDYIKIYRKGPSLSVDRLVKSEALLRPDEEFDVGTTIKNTGGYVLENIEFAVTAPDGLEVVDGGGGPVSIESLSLDEEKTVNWTLKGEKEGIYDFNVRINSKDSNGNPLDPILSSTALGIIDEPLTPSFEGLEGESSKVIELDDESLVLGNSNISLVFNKSSFGYVNYDVYVNGADGWYKVAVSEDFSNVLYLSHNGIPRGIPLFPSQYKVNYLDGQVSLVFTGINSAGDNEPTWTSNYEFILADNSSRVKTSYSIASNRDVVVQGLYGPTLYAGEGTFKEYKVDALFPGLEWLVDDEVSSSTLDFDPPLHLRLVPNWYKITIPSMVVSTGDYLVGLLWDANQKWDGIFEAPSAIFSSPNWYKGQENHLMGLFLPSTRSGHVQENRYYAFEPYQLEAGKPLTLEAYIVGKRDETSLTIINEWIDVFGLPDLQEYPRTIKEQIELNRIGFMDTVWDAEKVSWKHCWEWEAQNIPAYATYLWVDALLADDEAIKQQLKDRVDLVVETTKRRHGFGAIASTRRSHIRGWDLPFYVGGLEHSIATMRSEVEVVMRTQQRDGSWVFSPGDDPRLARLGTPGETATGLIATPADLILKWARMSGNQQALEAGLKALDYMDEAGLQVPRAAQTWECPVHSPDILSAGYSVSAYVEAYRITSDEHYLERAKYWAKTGIPFIYFWGTDDRPVMKGATIAIYGATHFVIPWVGRPVQWNGLVYAYSLLQLAKYDDSFPWEHLVELILRSAMWQQEAEGIRIGTYTDAWELGPDGPVALYLNPENISQVLFATMGADPAINTEILSGVRRRFILPDQDYTLHLNSAAEIVAASLEDGALVADLQFYKDEVAYSMISQMRAPRAVYRNGQRIERANNLDGVEDGWNHVRQGGEDFLIIKTTFSEDDIVSLRIEQ